MSATRAGNSGPPRERLDLIVVAPAIADGGATPLGLPARRRLLEWAARVGAVVLEDDREREVARPSTPHARLARHGRTGHRRRRHPDRDRPRRGPRLPGRTARAPRTGRGHGPRGWAGARDASSRRPSRSCSSPATSTATSGGCATPAPGRAARSTSMAGWAGTVRAAAQPPVARSRPTGAGTAERVGSGGGHDQLRLGPLNGAGDAGRSDELRWSCAIVGGRTSDPGGHDDAGPSRSRTRDRVPTAWRRACGHGQPRTMHTSGAVDLHTRRGGSSGRDGSVAAEQLAGDAFELERASAADRCRSRCGHRSRRRRWRRSCRCPSSWPGATGCPGPRRQ